MSLAITRSRRATYEAAVEKATFGVAARCRARRGDVLIVLPWYQDDWRKGVYEMAEVKVAQVGDVAPGTGAVVQADGKAVALFNVGGTFYATANACTHVGGPLGEGSLEGTTVTCPWHGSQFDVTSGQLVRGPARRPVATYKVRVQGNDVFVTTDDTPA